MPRLTLAGWLAAMDHFANETVIGLPDQRAAANGRIMADIWREIREHMGEEWGSDDIDG
jgi:hypothetical protein